jgi:transposase
LEAKEVCMNRRYSVEFEREAVRKMLERGYSVNEVSERLGVSTKSLLCG